MSTFKFTPKKGVLANLRKSVRAIYCHCGSNCI